jgi:hypothetical protein
MAGLLNVLAMLDVWGVAEQRWLRPATTAEEADATVPGSAPADPSQPTREVTT